MTKHFHWKDYLDDLDQLYDMAIGKENLTAALKIKEMQVKAYDKELEDLEKFDLKNMSDDQLETLCGLLSTKMPQHLACEDDQG